MKENTGAQARKSWRLKSASGAGRCEALGKVSRASVPECWKRACASAPPRVPEFAGDVANRKLESRIEAQIPAKSSGCAPAGPRRSRAIREEIIGHSRGFFGRLAGGGNSVHHGKLAFAMLHEPARQQGRGSFLHPLINQGRNLLAQVGGVAEPGKLVALQTVPGSRKEKLPRRLSLVAGHDGLLRRNRRRIVTRE